MSELQRGATNQLNLRQWLEERHANCLRIAKTKPPGADRDGWNEDAGYLQAAIFALSEKRATWIPVGEDMPEPRVNVLVHVGKTEFDYTAMWDGKAFCCWRSGYFINGVTHWLPLPEAPK